MNKAKFDSILSLTISDIMQ